MGAFSVQREAGHAARPEASIVAVGGSGAQSLGNSKIGLISDSGGPLLVARKSPARPAKPFTVPWHSLNSLYVLARGC